MQGRATHDFFGEYPVMNLFFSNRTIATCAAAAMIVMSPSAMAATTVFNDSASFGAASGPTTTVTFEGCAGGGSNAGSFCSGLPAGVTFTANEFYVAPPGQSANLTTALGINTPSGGINTINFAEGVNVFGMDLFQNFGGGSQSGTAVNFLIALYGSGGSLIQSFNPAVASGTGSFFGVLSTDAIFAAQVSQPGGFAVIDNVQFAAAVPEPATWLSMLLGFGAIGFAMRRRTANRQRVGRVLA
jgi:hypothetical protein